MTSADQVASLEASIRQRLRWHFRDLGFLRQGHGVIEPVAVEKDQLRALHRKLRTQVLRRDQAFIGESFPRLKKYFASGTDIAPDDISARLELVPAETEASDLFRLASLTWGVPVTSGYGRRMRFLVWDNSNGKLMGLIGLSDPVFNLHTRDLVIGWSGKDRLERLVDVMNAHVLGAVPPYNMLLGGKVVACLLRSKEVRDAFKSRYARTKGVISGKRKHASLVLITVTSSLGKSSVYDRLTLNGQRYLEPIGFTSGWGHFHVPDRLFTDIKKYLRIKHHDYAYGNNFGDGANWRLRTTRAALEMINLDPNLLRHNIKREIYVCRLARNADRVLRGEVSRPDYRGLLAVSDLSRFAVARWVTNRAKTRPEFRDWTLDNVRSLLDPRADARLSLPQFYRANGGLNNSSGPKGPARGEEEAATIRSLEHIVRTRLAPAQFGITRETRNSASQRPGKQDGGPRPPV